MKAFYRKVKWYALSVAISIIATIIALYWFKLFPKGTDLDLTAILTFVGIILALIGVLWSTNKQIENQNRESHRPYIVIDEVKQIQIDVKMENYTFWYKVETQKVIDNKILSKTNKKFEILISNIGYGLAKDVTFYQLSDKKEILKSYRKSTTAIPISTFDIAHDKNKSVVFDIDFFSREYKKVGNTENGKANFVYNYQNPDIFEFIIFYRDLNNNIYATIVMLNLYASDLDEYIYVDDNTSGFIECLDSCSIDYKALKSVYKNRIQ